MHSTPTLIFFLANNTIFAYDLAQHLFFEVDTKSFEELKLLSQDNFSSKNKSWHKFQNLGITNLVMDLSWQGDPLSHIAHQTSRINCDHTQIMTKEQFVQDYSHMSARINNIPNKDVPQNTTTVCLPQPQPDCFDHVSLGQCFRERKTTRNFIDQPIDLEQIGHILYNCFAPIHGYGRKEFTELNLKDLGYRRSSPSATGFASCDAILWANNISGLECGLYSYDDQSHQLIEHVNTLSEQELIYGMLDQFWIENMAAGIFIVNDLRRTWLKDIKCRGYLASHQEAGHLSENVLLSATALNLKTWLSGTFRDDYLQDKLSLASYRFVSLFIGMGYGSNDAVSKDYLAILDKMKS